jgi:hypothetical protein
MAEVNSEAMNIVSESTKKGDISTVFNENAR